MPLMKDGSSLGTNVYVFLGARPLRLHRLLSTELRWRKVGTLSVASYRANSPTYGLRTVPSAAMAIMARH